MVRYRGRGVRGEPSWSKSSSLRRPLTTLCFLCFPFTLSFLRFKVHSQIEHDEVRRYTLAAKNSFSCEARRARFSLIFRRSWLCWCISWAVIMAPVFPSAWMKSCRHSSSMRSFSASFRSMSSEDRCEGMEEELAIVGKENEREQKRWAGHQHREHGVPTPTKTQQQLQNDQWKKQKKHSLGRSSSQKKQLLMYRWTSRYRHSSPLYQVSSPSISYLVSIRSASCSAYIFGWASSVSPLRLSWEGFLDGISSLSTVVIVYE